MSESSSPPSRKDIEQGLSKISYYLADKYKIGSPLREKRASAIQRILRIVINICTCICPIALACLFCFILCVTPPLCYSIGHIAQSLFIFGVFWAPYPARVGGIAVMVFLDILWFALVVLVVIVGILLLIIGAFVGAFAILLVLYVFVYILLFIYTSIATAVSALGDYLEQRNTRTEPNNDTELSEGGMLE